MKQTFEEQQTGMYCTMQSLIHQIEKASYDKKYRFKFKKECDHFYNVLERLCEAFTDNFNGNKETDNAYTQIVAEIDEIAGSIKIRINEDEENTEN